MSEGPGAGTGFPPAEHAARVAALQSAMAGAAIDALLLTAPADIAYVTGFLTRFWESPTRPWFVVVPAAAPPVAVIPAIGAALMGRTWMADVRCWNAPDPADDGVSLLAATLREVAPRRGRLGVAMGAESSLRMPLADFARLQAAVAPAVFADATTVIRAVRAVKSPAEIDRIRASCAAAGAAFDRLPGMVGPGRDVAALCRAFQIACLEGGADWISYLAVGVGPGGYDDIIAPGAGRPLAAGDVLMLDTGAVRAGYFCDFDRNVAVGHATDATRRAHDILFAATEAGLAAARPGVAACEVRHAMAAAIAAAGGRPCAGRMGHGVGLQLTEWPSLTPDDRTVLREGMALAIEPAIETGEGRMMVHEENVVLRADGAALLTPRAPAQIPVAA